MDQIIKTNRLVATTTIGLLTAVIYHFFIMKIYFGFGYPYDTFLFLPDDRFMDLVNPLQMIKDFSPYTNNKEGIPANYFPFTYLILYPFSFISLGDSIIIFLLIFTAYTFKITNYFIGKKSTSKYENIRNVFVLSFFTYPFLFTFDRGNIEAIVFIFEALFLISYLQKRSYISAIFLSLAASMKFYPAFLAIIFIKNRQFKQFGLCTLLTIVISVISLSIFNDGNLIQNIADFQKNLKDFNKLYMLNDDLNSNGLSIFSLIKFELASIKIILSDLSESQTKILLIYFISFCLISYLLINYYILKFENVLWKQLMLIVSSSLILFNVSYDYKMISLLLPIFLYLNDEKKYKFDSFYICGFSLLLIPKQIAVKSGDFGYFMISNFLNLAIILGFIVIIMIEKKYDKEVTI
ncbi:MAG: DUF2029 domain-containing protein [Pelagibacterales bacterium]|nr:DUF2029 domain-containing protein [Pelagibacterales bacterium]